ADKIIGGNDRVAYIHHFTNVGMRQDNGAAQSRLPVDYYVVVEHYFVHYFRRVIDTAPGANEDAGTLDCGGGQARLASQADARRDLASGNDQGSEAARRRVDIGAMVLRQ